jgi:hypothetical protein
MTDVSKKILEGEGVLKSIDKLKRDKVLISINPKEFVEKYSKVELEKLEKMDKEKLSEDERKVVETLIKTTKESIETYKGATLEGYLVPLKYVDIQTVKNGVIEAIKYATEFNWDEDVKMNAMVREEHTWTVYLSLRKKDDVTKRYYESPEAIAKEPESVIEQLYALYLKYYVLGEEERKNS